MTVEYLTKQQARNMVTFWTKNEFRDAWYHLDHDAFFFVGDGASRVFYGVKRTVNNVETTVYVPGRLDAM